MNNILKSIFDNVIEGNKEEVVSGVQSALDSDIPTELILNEALIGAMKEVGRLFEVGDFYVPEMLVASRSMQAGLAILKPLFAQSGIKAKGTIVMGTVQGDLHEIGKNLVCMMLEAAGFEVIDLGTDVSPEKFAQAVRENRPQVVGMSALLTTTMTKMRSTIEAIEDIGLRENVKIMIGGAPVTEQFAQEISADGYAPNASRAVKIVETLIGLNLTKKA